MRHQKLKDYSRVCSIRVWHENIYSLHILQVNFEKLRLIAREVRQISKFNSIPYVSPQFFSISALAHFHSLFILSWIDKPLFFSNFQTFRILTLCLKTIQTVREVLVTRNWLAW